MSRAGCVCFLGQFKGIIIYTSQCILQSFEVILESPILKNLTGFLQLVIAVYVCFFLEFSAGRLLVVCAECWFSTARNCY